MGHNQSSNLPPPSARGFDASARQVHFPTPHPVKERLLLRLSVVEAVGLAPLEDVEDDAELRELELLAQPAPSVSPTRMVP